jgi:hypothetical protein
MRAAQGNADRVVAPATDLRPDRQLAVAVVVEC